MLGRYIQNSWYQPFGILTLILLPLSILFCVVAMARRCFYRMNILHSEKVKAPVIIVGNISVGGTGKTPLVIAITQYLKAQGYRPGVICRGYRGKARNWPQRVTVESDPYWVGDEAVIIANRCRCPVCAGPSRVESAKLLIESEGCNVIISDDGLQHYNLKRDVEIAVVDAQRGLGNGLCLPAGPLRELPFRLKTVNMKVCNGAEQGDMYGMELKSYAFHNINNETELKPLDAFAGVKVNAVSGIGNNARFFKNLQRLGILINEHQFSDHHSYTVDELRFNDELPLLMTEKDAVKCKKFSLQNAWYLKVDALISNNFFENITGLLRKYYGQKVA